MVENFFCDYFFFFDNKNNMDDPRWWKKDYYCDLRTKTVRPRARREPPPRSMVLFRRLAGKSEKKKKIPIFTAFTGYRCASPSRIRKSLIFESRFYFWELKRSNNSEIREFFIFFLLLSLHGAVSPSIIERDNVKRDKGTPCFCSRSW